MMHRLAMVAGMLLAACSPRLPPVVDAKVTGRCADPAAVSRLAGAWLYEERGYIYTLRLDKQGNGSYEWKDGRFMTTCLDGLAWRGRWVDVGKDSEGDFAIQLGKDLNIGKGRWRYSRIGQDNAQTQSGGEFQLKRIGKDLPDSPDAAKGG